MGSISACNPTSPQRSSYFIAPSITATASITSFQPSREGSLFLLVEFQPRMACEEASAFHLVAPGFQRVFLIDPSGQIGLIVFLRDLDGYVHAVVFNHCEDERPKGRWFLHGVDIRPSRRYALNLSTLFLFAYSLEPVFWQAGSACATLHLPTLHQEKLGPHRERDAQVRFSASSCRFFGPQGASC